MPMKLSVGVTRKVGQPNYSSSGASCAVELNIELASSDLGGDATEFHRRVRDAYAACARAVQEELDRHRPSPGNNPATSHEDPDEAGDGGPARRPGGSGPPRRPATAAQVRALGRLAGRRGVDLEELVGRRFGVDGPEELSIAEASRLIDELQQAPAEATA
jgi:hypothetical protein